MRKLRTHYHPEAKNLEEKSVLERLATRAISIQNKEILLLYTERYQDYSLPGGGVNQDEDIISAMKRELCEETGARNIRNVQAFGIYEEYRPWYKPGFDFVHMTSYCYTCDVDYDLAQTQLENYEIKNGMRPLWVDIHEAIQHNQQTIEKSDKKGLSIERETFLLELIIKEKNL